MAGGHIVDMPAVSNLGRVLDCPWCAGVYCAALVVAVVAQVVDVPLPCPHRRRCRCSRRVPRRGRPCPGALSPPRRPVRTVRVHRSDRMLTQSLSSLTSAALVKQPADQPSNEGTGGGTRIWQKRCGTTGTSSGNSTPPGRSSGNCMSRIRLTVALPGQERHPRPRLRRRRPRPPP